jgi:hypothetical protein
MFPAMTTKQQRTRQRTADDPEQYKRFLEAAKKAGADESEEGADRAFKKIVPPKKSKQCR